MRISLAAAVTLGVLVLGACTDSAKSPTGVGLPVQELTAAQGRAPRGGVEVKQGFAQLPGRSGRIKLPDHINSQFLEIEERQASLAPFLERFANTPVAKKLEREGHQVDKVKHKIRAEAWRKLQQSGRAASMDFTCLDLSIAIYETNLLYKAAVIDYYETLADVTLANLIDRGLPSESDFVEVNMKGHDVMLHSTTLDILSIWFFQYECWK